MKVLPYFMFVFEQVLHGAEVFGTRLKVFKAEERPDQNRKRQRLEDSPF